MVCGAAARALRLWLNFSPTRSERAAQAALPGRARLWFRSCWLLSCTLLLSFSSLRNQ